MKNLREYVINFGSLKPGHHEYEFDIDDHFFQRFEFSLVKSGSLQLHLVLDKQRENFLSLHFRIRGNIKVECDRCLDPFDLPVDLNKVLHVKLENEEAADENDELLFLRPDTYELDISPFVYDFINLSLPLRRVCDIVGKNCNPEMLEYLARGESEETEEVDPRWAQLKKLNKN